MCVTVMKLQSDRWAKCSGSCRYA